MPLHSPARRSSSSVFWALTQSDNGRAPGQCLTTFYLSPTQNILPFTQLVFLVKLKLVVCAHHNTLKNSSAINENATAAEPAAKFAWLIEGV
jgi:hypothetical protein